jgi:hypothetical protein
MPVSVATVDGAGSNPTDGGFTAVGAATMWQCLTTDNADTSYVYHGTGGATERASFNVTLPTDASAAGSVQQIDTVLKIRAESGTPATFGLVYLPATGLWTSASQLTTTSYVVYTFSLLTRPVTLAAWQIQDLANVQIGWEARTAQLQRATYGYCNMTYTMASGGWSSLVYSLFGTLVSVGLHEMPKLARAYRKARGTLFLPSEYEECWRELRQPFRRYVFLEA